MKKQLLTTALVLALAGSQGFCITNAVQISEGGWHSTALLSDGTLKAWGFSNHGQCGELLADFASPVTVSNLSTNIAMIAAGGEHNLALLTNGSIYAWGYGGFNQLGISNTASRYIPVLVSNIAPATAVAAGGEHSLAISNQLVYAWGYNNWGQAGQTGGGPIVWPTLVPGLSNVTQIHAGDFFSQATSGGYLYSWGANDEGQLGCGLSGAVLGSTNVPQQVLYLTNVTASAAAVQFALAVQNKKVYAWGHNDNYQCGYTSPTNAPTLVTDSDVYGDETNITINVTTTYYTNADPETNIYVNVVGSTYVTNYPAPTYGPDAQTNYMCVTNVLSYQNFTNAYTNFCIDTVYTTNYVTNVTHTRTLQGHAVQVAGGTGHSLALTDDRHLFAWGRDLYGALGINGTDGNYKTAKPLPVMNPGNTGPLTNVVAISVGMAQSASGGTYFSTALLGDGTVVTWGRNSITVGNYGQLGNGTNVDSPLPVVTDN